MRHTLGMQNQKEIHAGTLTLNFSLDVNTLVALGIWENAHYWRVSRSILALYLSLLRPYSQIVPLDHNQQLREYMFKLNKPYR